MDYGLFWVCMNMNHDGNNRSYSPSSFAFCFQEILITVSEKLMTIPDFVCPNCMRASIFLLTF